MEQKHSQELNYGLLLPEKTNPLKYVTCLVYHGRQNSILPLRFRAAQESRVQELEKYFWQTLAFIAFNTASFPRSIPYFSCEFLRGEGCDSFSNIAN